MEPNENKRLAPSTIYALALTTRALLMKDGIDRRRLGRQLADTLADAADQLGLAEIDRVRIPRSLSGRVEVAKELCRLIAAGMTGFVTVDQLREVDAAMRGGKVE